MSTETMVSVICTTYNHGRYIRKCLESLVYQKTNFAYEIIVHDDCSTDNTAEIIHEFELKYPDKIKPVYRKENLYSKGIRPAYAASQFAKGYYLTHCEGDDYWCDDEKLQLQFDYMQTHKDCSLCFHNTYTYYDDTGITEDNWIFWKDRKYKGAGIYTSDELVELNVVPLSSIMYRSKDNDDIDLTSKLVKYGDIAKTLWLADKGYGYCMPRRMSVYRRNANESAMTKVYGSVEQYNKGILATVETFENFDNYTNHRFSHIITPKISELKRKCLSIDMEKLADCVSKDKETYIFGTGVYAMLCSAEMSKNNIDYTGFVVSDGQEKSENFKEHPVKYISEVTDPTALIIPAVGANVLALIKENLNDLGFHNVCEVCKEGDMSEKRMADKAMEEKNILIFPAGSEIGLEIFNSLKYQKYIHVFGGTSGEDHTQYLYKNIIRLPYISDENFIARLNEQIEKYNIDYIFPAYDVVQCCLMEHAQKINAGIISSKREVVSICRNKQKTYEFLGDVWYCPKFYNDINSVETYPVFIKPKEGQGSEGVHKVMNEKELVYYLQNENKYVICEYLGGKEYTVDCFTDEMGTLRISKTRIRNKIKSGISVAAEILEDDSEFVRIAEDLNSRFDFRGAWFFQVKRNEAGCLKLLEVSPRISGTMGLSRNMGINFPMLSLYLHMGINVEILDNHYSIAVDRSLISRYKINMEYDTVYIDFDDTLIVKGKVNVKLLAFLYQLKNNSKKIVLLTKHVGDIYEELEEYYIDKRIFNEIILMNKAQNKSDYIDNNSIFIDDSFMERKKVHIAKQIPVFDLDSVEALIDWRM